MSNNTNCNNRGFTLIEVIVSLVLVGIIGAIVGMLLVQISKGFVFSKKTAATAQKGQITISRLVKEFSSITSISSGTATSITFTRDPGVTHTISWAGANNPLLIATDIVTDNVNSFNLQYYDSYNDPSPSPSYLPSTAMIEITLELKEADYIPSEFINRVFLYKLIE
jgi:prepilin-type N-terminal cleavage/methylation domain-containing protein